MTEPHATRLKRLQMRSMRRGIREMDLILSGFAAARLETMEAADLDLYEALLQENDQELYAWVNGQSPAETRFAGLVAEISDHARKGIRPVR